MIFSGTNLKGVNTIGKATLGSIGDLLLHYDYRMGVQTVNVSGLDLVTNVSDLSSNNFNLSQSTSSRRPALYSDGFGSALSSSNNMQGTPNSLLKCLHDGTAHLIFAVQQFDNPTNVDQRPIILSTGQLGSGAGILVQTLAVSNNFGLTTYNSSGTSLGNATTGNNTVPEDSTFRLLMRIYYGSGAGANNNKLVIANSTYLQTYSPAFSNASPIRLQSLGFGTTLNSKIKTVGAYNLSGKSVIDIDNFVQLFISVLKEDSEYSGLITI